MAEKSIRGALPPAFRDTGFEIIVQDLMSSTIPGVDVLVPPLAAAAGVLHADARLVIMPDDPGLGEFRTEFAGAVGSFMEFPTDGFRGSTEVLAPGEFLSRRRAGIDGLPDPHAFLRARLLDLLIGDWDRHYKQWRWARMPGLDRLQPIPEDRDQAFSAYDGVAMDIVRAFGSQMVDFEDRYASMERMIRNGSDHDRLVLADLEREEWLATAREVSAAVTDDVIRATVARLPEAYERLIGSELVERLARRRDDLPRAAVALYEMLSRRVDVAGTDRPELFQVEYLAGGDVQVRVSILDDVPQTPYFTRRFRRHETREVRLYLHGGADVVRVHGHADDSIRIRAVAGTELDRIDDAIGSTIEPHDFADRRGSHAAPEPASPAGPESLFTSAAIRMPGTVAQDWGRRSVPTVVFGYHEDPGLVLGGGYTWELHRFRSRPWGQRHRLRAGLALGPGFGMVEYDGGFRPPESDWHAGLLLRTSSLEQLRFYGFGNDTPADLPEDAYRIRERRVTLFPTLNRDLGPAGVLSLGAVLHYSDSTETEADTVLARQEPYGFGTFAQASLRIGYAFDNRDAHRVLQPGRQWSIDAALTPALSDVERTYGWVAADVGWHLEATPTTLLSFYGGGKKLWGRFPYFEAAYLGGQGNALGYHWNRFAGDASLHASAEIRWSFREVRSWVPGELGITAGFETGRVFFEDENSSRWHSAAGIGLFFSPFDRMTIFQIGVTRGAEDTFVILRSGLRFSGRR
jgi:hypothetical protein